MSQVLEAGNVHVVALAEGSEEPSAADGGGGVTSTCARLHVVVVPVASWGRKEDNTGGDQLMKRRA